MIRGLNLLRSWTYKRRLLVSLKECLVFEGSSSRKPSPEVFSQENCATSKQKVMLSKDFSPDDVKEALFDIEDQKAPGLDAIQIHHRQAFIRPSSSAPQQQEERVILSSSAQPQDESSLLSSQATGRIILSSQQPQPQDESALSSHRTNHPQLFSRGPDQDPISVKISVAPISIQNFRNQIFRCDLISRSSSSTVNKSRRFVLLRLVLFFFGQISSSPRELRSGDLFSDLFSG
ncbi:hypothetical protein AKJ16_DCAP06023 [Drosera capensis]